ncbi:MAG: hypothetical protein ABDK92_01340 [Atribacterota bacterium]
MQIRVTIPITIRSASMRGRSRGCSWYPLIGVEVLIPAVLVVLLRGPSYGYALLEDLKSLRIGVPGVTPVSFIGRCG